jgi:hypothetical protein
MIGRKKLRRQRRLWIAAGYRVLMIVKAERGGETACRGHDGKCKQGSWRVRGCGRSRSIGAALKSQLQ